MDEKKFNAEDIFSRTVRADRRTYFFDVKSTKANELYLTVTESKKRYNEDGSSYYDKHKLFLYNEDFEKFDETLSECLSEIKKLYESGKYQIAEKKDYND